MQLLNALRGKSDGWVNHPACRMWKGFESALAVYMNCCIKEWVDRGYNNTMKLEEVRCCILPKWIGCEEFHRSHRSNLLRKDKQWYSQFGWTELDDLPYVWPI